MPHPQLKKLRAKLLKSRAITVGLLVVAFAVSLAVGRELARKVSVAQEIKRLSSEISQAETSTRELEQLISVLQSNTTRERAARTRLHLQKPGEKVLVIPELSVTEQAAPSQEAKTSEQDSKPTNNQRWWEFLFPDNS